MQAVMGSTGIQKAHDARLTTAAAVLEWRQQDNRVCPIHARFYGFLCRICLKGHPVLLMFSGGQNKVARCLSQAATEHGGKSTGAVITQIQRDPGDGLAGRQLGQGCQ